ncbi:unnamed protein product [Cunninghamella echinulata]
MARILLQLYILPQHLLSQIDIIQTVTEGYKVYGDGYDLNGFLSFCYSKSINQIEQQQQQQSNNNINKFIYWPWCHLTLSQYSDWQHLDQEQYNRTDNIGLRLQISSETVRPGIDLVRYGKKNSLLLDKKFAYQQKEKHIPIDSILNGTLTYITTKSKSISNDSKIISMINQRLSQFRLDAQNIQLSKKQIEIDYTLTGVLMVKYDALNYNGMLGDAWCLYLRDYVEDASGSKWRIISNTKDKNGQDIKVSSQQALSDIRGIPVKDCSPSTYSSNYRPVYLFYCNHDLITRSTQDSSHNQSKDTLNNTSFEENDDEPMSDGSSSLQLQLHSTPQHNQQQQGDNVSYQDYIETNSYDSYNNKPASALEDELCKHCGIPDTVDDINTIFFCDLCELGVHQLCEDPPISAYEVEIDPWYCRSCTKIIGKNPLRTASTPKSSRPNYTDMGFIEGDDDGDFSDDQFNTKRQRLS